MASELQRRKTALVFSAMDVDSDGFLEREDFAALTARWTVNRGLAPDSPDAARLSEIMMGWWATLLAASDVNRDDKVALDEVLLVVDRLPADTAPVVATATATAMFEAVDANGDGRISAAEYHELIETWNGVATDASPPPRDFYAWLRSGAGAVVEVDCGWAPSRSPEVTADQVRTFGVKIQRTDLSVRRPRPPAPRSVRACAGW